MLYLHNSITTHIQETILPYYKSHLTSTHATNSTYMVKHGRGQSY